MFNEKKVGRIDWIVKRVCFKLEWSKVDFIGGVEKREIAAVRKFVCKTNFFLLK